MIIKFRAWDRTTHKDGVMVPWEELKKFPCEVVFLPLFEVELMQYTGQTDSGGQEIYEGDIIEFTYWWFDGDERESQLIGVIGFENMSFTLERITNDFFQNHTGYKKGEGSISFGELTYSDDDFKVIGNKFENPELLEQ